MKHRRRERRRLRQLRDEAPSAGSWSPEHFAAVEEELRQIMLLDVDGRGDQTDIRLSWKAVELFVEIVGIRQEAELAALEAQRRPSISVVVNLL